MKFFKKNETVQKFDTNTSRRFTLGQYFAAVFALLLSVTAISYAAGILTLNVFNNGDVITSKSVNDNFTYVQTNLDVIAASMVGVASSIQASNTNISNNAAAVRGIATGGTGANTAAGALANLGAVGAGQTWHPYLNSAAGFGSNQVLRAAGVNLVNNTGRPIQLAIGIFYSSAPDAMEATLYVDGVTVGYVRGGGSAYAFQNITLTGMIPAGSTYQISITTGSIVFWSELS